MRAVLLASSFLLAAALTGACWSSGDVESSPSDAGAEGGGPQVITGDSGTEHPAGTGGDTGLPCDVQAVLENRCIACHDGGQARAMLTYSDLVAPSNKDPSMTVAALAVARMKDGSMPPPPALRAENDEVATFEAWVNAGTPKNPTSCTDPPPDGGVAGDAGLPVGDGGLCASGTYWKNGDTGDQKMHPGMACNACHQQKGGPNLRIAGTVYAGAHDVDDCNGQGPPPNLTVIVTASDGKEFSMPVNSAGNFLLDTMKPKAPFRARVTDGTKIRAMNGTVTSGDCNSCHTSAGKNGAPGRILLP